MRQVLNSLLFSGLLVAGTPLAGQQPDTTASFRREVLELINRRSREARLDTIPLAAPLPDTVLARERADAVSAALEWRSSLIGDDARASACDVANLVGRDSTSAAQLSPYIRPLLIGSAEPGCAAGSGARPRQVPAWWIPLSVERDGPHGLLLHARVSLGGSYFRETYRLVGRRTADGLYSLRVIDLRIHSPAFAQAAADETPSSRV